MHIGWVLVWFRKHDVLRVLRLAGFQFGYRIDGVSVYRPAGR
jgi:hypothetical protein